MQHSITKPLLYTWLWLIPWFISVGLLSYFTAGFYNFDSIKYVDVAQHMLNTHQYILPYFQNHPYPDKGPLMFWLFIAGWKIVGINLWWPQLLMFIFATASIGISMGLAKQLWPQEPYIKMLTPYILLGLPAWIALSTQIRVDVLLLFFCLLGIYALVRTLQGKKIFWLLYVFAITLGGLCKGPVILIYTFLPALFFPLFSDDKNLLRVRWYIEFIGVSLVAILLPLLWVVPAILLGGKAYAHAIIYGQISGHSDIKGYSIWYYIIRLPILLLPWLFYLPFYYGSKKIVQTQWNFGVKICLLIISLSLVIFSFVGQKRLHYINPDIPLFALLFSLGINNFIKANLPTKKFYQMFVSSLAVIAILSLLIWPLFSANIDTRTQLEFSYLFTWKKSVISGLILSALIYYFYQPQTIWLQIFIIALPFIFIATAFNLLNIFVATL